MQTAFAIPINNHTLARLLVRWLAADADIRQEHQRIFQALALVQGDDLHAARIRFQPQLLGVVVVVGIGDAPRQPVDQAMRAECARIGFLQQFGQLQIVGEAAFAIDQCEQALPVGGAEVADQGERAAALPAFAPVQRLLLPAAVTLAVAFKCGDGDGVFADQDRGQGGAQAAVVARVEQGLQQGKQFQRLFRGEQALLAGGHRRDAHRAERLLDARGLAVAAHQHGDIAGLHRATAHRGRAVAATGQPAADRCNARGGRQLARAAGAPGLGLAFRRRRRFRRPPQRQCRRSDAIALQVFIDALGPSPHRVEGDAVGEEGIGVAGLRVQRVDGRQHAGARAEVVAQRRRPFGGDCRGQIGAHIAATEAVDGLLGVADQKQRRFQSGGLCERAFAEHVGKDRPLAVVGVLEFVHQRDGVLRAQAFEQGVGLCALQCVRDTIDEVVVGLHAALPLEQRQPCDGIVA